MKDAKIDEVLTQKTIRQILLTTEYTGSTAQAESTPPKDVLELGRRLSASLSSIRVATGHEMRFEKGCLKVILFPRLTNSAATR